MTVENGNPEPDDDGGLYDLEEPIDLRPALPGQVVVRADVDELIDSLAAELVIHAENCVREFGDFHIALSGGPSFEPLYRRLMYDPNYRRIPWRRAHVWFVDESCVPSDDERSRCGMVRDLIGDHADIPPEQFHMIPADRETAVGDYEAQLREALAWREKGQDRLDYALLTIDPDGGTAGIKAANGFNAADADARDPERLVCLCRAGDGSTPDCISLTLPFLNASRFIAVFVTGTPLAATVQHIAGSAASAVDLPIRGIAPLNGELKWYLDAPACGASGPPTRKLETVSMDMLETKTVTDRRKLSFSRMDEIVADVDSLDGGELRSSGNWTPAQDVQHVSLIIERSLDGFGGLKGALPIRLMIGLMKKKILREPFQPGIKLPEKFSFFVPGPETKWDAAIAHLKHQIGRIEKGEKMTAISPIFGKLSHEQWVQMHCRHAELHLSFIHPV